VTCDQLRVSHVMPSSIFWLTTMTQHYSRILMLTRAVYIPSFFLSNLAFIIQEQASSVAPQVDRGRAAAILCNVLPKIGLQEYQQFSNISSERFVLDVNDLRKFGSSAETQSRSTIVEPDFTQGWIDCWPDITKHPCLLIAWSDTRVL